MQKVDSHTLIMLKVDSHTNDTIISYINSIHKNNTLCS